MSKACIPRTVAVFFLVKYFLNVLREGEHDERIARGKAKLEGWRRRGHWCQREKEALKGSDVRERSCDGGEKRKCWKGTRDKNTCTGTTRSTSALLRLDIIFWRTGCAWKEKYSTHLTLLASFYGVLFHFQCWTVWSHKINLNLGTKRMMRNKRQIFFFFAFLLWRAWSTNHFKWESD